MGTFPADAITQLGQKMGWGWQYILNMDLCSSCIRYRLKTSANQSNNKYIRKCVIFEITHFPVIPVMHVQRDNVILCVCPAGLWLPTIWGGQPGLLPSGRPRPLQELQHHPHPGPDRQGHHWPLRPSGHTLTAPLHQSHTHRRSHYHNIHTKTQGQGCALPMVRVVSMLIVRLDYLVYS